MVILISKFDVWMHTLSFNYHIYNVLVTLLSLTLGKMRRISYHVIKLVQSNYISIIDVTMIDVSSIKVDVSKDFGVHGLWNYIILYIFM